MVSYRLIGTGVTDSNGIATCNYTGSGKGEVDFVASTDNASHISESSILSETYELIDGVFLDSGIRSSRYVRWRNNSDTVTDTFESDGTLLEQANTGTNGWYLASTSATDAYWGNVTNWTPNYAIEFDIVSMTQNAFFRIDSVYINLFSLYNVGDRVRITYDGSYVDCYKVGSDTRLNHVALTSNPVSYAFSLGDGGTIKFKDFVIYPI